MPATLIAQTIPAAEKADTIEMSRRAIGLTPEELPIVQMGLSQIPKDGYAYLAIHGDGASFLIFEANSWKTISHKSLARWIHENPTVYKDKDIVLLSCGDTISSQKLADALGTLDKAAKLKIRRILAWNGEVEIFENGFIRGSGKCKQYQLNIKPALELMTPAIPKGNSQLPTEGMLSVFLGNHDWSLLKTNLINKLSSLAIEPNATEATKLVHKVVKELEKKGDLGMTIAAKINEGVFDGVSGYNNVIKKLSSPDYSNAAKQAFDKADELLKSGTSKKMLVFEDETVIYDIDLGIKREKGEGYTDAWQFKTVMSPNAVKNNVVYTKIERIAQANAGHKIFEIKMTSGSLWEVEQLADFVANVRFTKTKYPNVVIKVIDSNNQSKLY